jgi:4-hydroxysphinganine ceramide fatty acyl 2-hydroxylase
MPGRMLPSIPPAEIAAKNSAESCYVTVGTRVFDITDFVEDHPGGPGLILEYGGKDVKDIMEDHMSHAHSEAAHEILEEHLIGFVADDSMLDSALKGRCPNETQSLPLMAGDMPEADGENRRKIVFKTTGLSSAEDLSVPTDAQIDYRTHKFLDLNRPLFMQVWSGGFTRDFYLEQVHRPRHYKGGESAPLFGNFLEPLSKTPWWVVPLVWLPPVMCGTYIARGGLASWGQVCAYWFLGLGLWTIVEYGLHRFLFHVDKYVYLHISLDSHR